MHPPKHIQLIVFDMDGTITIPTLDFAEIKQAIGAPPEIFTLEYLLSLEGQERKDKFAILHQFEDEAARNAIPRPGAVELIHRLYDVGYTLALLTRNSDRSVNLIFKTLGLRFHHVFTRDNAPAKPDPSPITNLMQKYNIEGNQAVMIGDFWIDVKTGKAAGCRTVFFKTPGIPEQDEIVPDVTVESFEKLEEVLAKWND